MDLRLNLVTECSNATNFLHTIDMACQSGVTMVQFRDKEHSVRECIDLGFKVKKITDLYGIPLIVNDKVDVALAIDADGVHLGAMDMPVSIAREILGSHKIIGATAKSVDTAINAMKEGADYLSVGAIYPSLNKVTTITMDVPTLNEIIAAVGIPVIAGGGLNHTNLSILNSSKIEGISVSSAIMNASDVKSETRQLREVVDHLMIVTMMASVLNM